MGETSAEGHQLGRYGRERTSDVRSFYLLVPSAARQGNVRLYEMHSADDSLTSVFSYLVQQ